MNRKRNWAKIIKRTLLITFLFGLFWFFGANWAIVSNAEGKVFDQVSDCPKVKVALVLGTSRTLKHGNDNLYFSYRIKAAVELYRAGKVKYILVSGDNGQTTYDEPTDMKNALIAAGIPAKRIFLDYAGFRTLDSMERALKVFGQKEVIVVSQRFHNERAIYLGEHFGMTVYGYNAQDVAKMGGFKTKVRERFARMKVFWDIVFGVDSKFLGESVEIK
ncbi:ElyC/SanA/YdcF family protein [Fluviicola taffensis]|uniref:SanA/YdcF family protein n=1 Tax=Fluviicola taffensis TaxID=191579 RepID=UPI003137DC6E